MCTQVINYQEMQGPGYHKSQGNNYLWKDGELATGTGELQVSMSSSIDWVVLAGCLLYNNLLWWFLKRQTERMF